MILVQTHNINWTPAHDQFFKSREWKKKYLLLKTSFPADALPYYHCILPQKLPNLPRNSKCMMPADLRWAPRAYTFTEVYLASKGTGFKPQGKGCFRVCQNVSTILIGDKPPHNWKKRRSLERHEKIKKWLEKLQRYVWRTCASILGSTALALMDLPLQLENAFKEHSSEHKS